MTSWYKKLVQIDFFSHPLFAFFLYAHVDHYQWISHSVVDQQAVIFWSRPVDFSC